MEEYRNKLKIQNVFFSVCSAVLIVVQILAYSGVIDPVNSGKSWADFWHGFIAGVALGVTAIMIFGLIKNLIALKNNKQLKKLYVKENDERKKGNMYKRQKCRSFSISLLYASSCYYMRIF